MAKYCVPSDYNHFQTTSFPLVSCLLPNTLLTEVCKTRACGTHKFCFVLESTEMASDSRLCGRGQRKLDSKSQKRPGKF